MMLTSALCSLVTMGPKHEIDSLASLVHSAIQVPLAAHLDVGFIHPPALANLTFVPAKGFLEQRYELDAPAMHARMVELEAPFGHHIL